jgi:malate synthase
LTNRLYYQSNIECNDIFTEDFKNLLVNLHDKFNNEVKEIRKDRLANQEKARNGTMPSPLAKSDANGEWEIKDLPEDLRTPGIEISGPASIASMLINALNPGPGGVRAEGDLDDDEDAAGHTLEDSILAARNRMQATLGTLSFDNPKTGKHYELQTGKIPFFMHRERGLHLDEPMVKIDGSPIAATILGTALTLFFGGREQHKKGDGVYFYIPKTESARETKFYNNLFTEIKNSVPEIFNINIKAIILIESLPAVFQMEEMLFALGDYAAGLNAARWDLKASILEYVMHDKEFVWPDRFDVTIQNTEFMSNIFRRLVAVCLKHNAVPIGGMATALPSKDEEVNIEAAKSIKADKEWEANQGFIRAWVAHIYHMDPASEPFKKLRESGWEPTDEMKNPDNYPVKIDNPNGTLTKEGTRQNIRTLLEYIEGWLNGRGAKGIDRLAGKPGKRPALMEDLATARISTGQIAQRIIHKSFSEDTEQEHSYKLVKEIILDETKDIIKLLGENASDDQINKYEDSSKIAMQWIKNYTEFNFRSLGSYSRKDLDDIANEKDAF